MTGRPALRGWHPQSRWKTVGIISAMAASESEMPEVRAPVLIEALFLVLRPAQQDGETEHEQDVADDRAGDRRFDHAGEAFVKRDAGDDQFGGVTESGVKNPPSPSPTRAASASVARPIQPATGIIAMAEQMKSAVGVAPGPKAETEGDRDEDEQPVERRFEFQGLRWP